jgi:hypothetical protein
MQLCCNLLYYPRVFPRGTKESHDNPQNIRSPDLDLNHRLSEYEARMLTNPSLCSQCGTYSTDCAFKALTKIVIILSCDRVTIHGVWFRNWIY